MAMRNGEAVAVPVGTEIAEGVKFNNDDRRTVFGRTLAFFDRLVLDAHDERLAHPRRSGSCSTSSERRSRNYSRMRPRRPTW